MKFIKWLDENFEAYFLATLIAVSVVIIFVQVIMRYVFSNSLSWSEELARYLFLYSIWLGASFAVKKSSHLRIEIINNMLKGKKSIMFDSLGLIIWLVFTIYLTYITGNLTLQIFARGQLSPAMRIPMGYAYLSVPFGCSVMIIRLVQQLLLNFKKLKKKEEFQ